MMKSRKKILLVSIGCILLSIHAAAQLPVCAGPGNDIIYYVEEIPGTGTTGIYVYNTSQPFSSTNPYLDNTVPPFPSSEIGLAVSANLNGLGPSPTFYIASGGNYYYFDGVSWANTGHQSGAINPGAGGGFIYSLKGNTGEVFKYDGSGDAVLLTTLSGWAQGYRGPWDLVADCEGNFYVLRGVYPQQLEKYSPAGILLQTWTANFPPLTNIASGGLFSIVNDTLYATEFSSSGSMWKGIMAGSNINFTLISSPFLPSPVDGASCSRAIRLSAARDTVYSCGSNIGVPLSTSGQPPYTWSVLSGPGVINGNGQTVTINASATTVILSTSNTNSECGPLEDTFIVIVPTATVNAGADVTLQGCAPFLTTLNAVLSNTSPNIVYQYLWSPSVLIQSGANSLSAIVGPDSTTDFVITINTDSLHGNCSWEDTVSVVVKDSTITAAFGYEIHFGCGEDTVLFQNLSANASDFAWSFGDALLSNESSPVHIYADQNLYNVRLIAANGQCSDTVEKQIDIRHLLKASFAVSDDTICQGEAVIFTNTSITSGSNETYFHWQAGNNRNDTSANTAFQFEDAGLYLVMLTATDFVPCSDTAYRTIQVDPYPNLSLISTDSTVCEGKSIVFSVGHSFIGNTALLWSFGDSPDSLDLIPPVVHAFDTSGTFIVSVSASYRACPDTSVTGTIVIKPFPKVDLGLDTSMCLNGSPILLGDNYHQYHLGSIWKWNTGDTTRMIVARHPGVYTTEVNEGGCVTSDSIEVAKSCYIDFPNSFSPNNDGVNDYFFPRQLLSARLTQFTMAIFNRWGQLIFETASTGGRGWDGKMNGIDQPQGVYVYMAEATIENNKQEKYQGNLTLIR